LQLVAEWIRTHVRDSDATARIGGDEFILLLAGIQDAEVAAQLARRLIDYLSLPFDLGNFEARIGASIGIEVGPRDGATAEVLISNADIALYQAKANGRGGFCIFESGMDKIQQERRSMEHDPRQAVAEESFELVYQPQFLCANRAVVSFEALMRWWHPVRGAISPGEFIPIAEATGLIVPLGRWALRTACLAASSWPKPCTVAVNVSARQFIGDDFADTVQAVLQETGLSAARLELEITESLMMQDTERALNSLRRLKALGVHLALDDFGTGFSSLSFCSDFILTMRRSTGPSSAI
jgi:predicted signal transduction protein with EAL and GGDEF domain